MKKRKLSRNAQCPCGSGKKYKHCCIGKGFEWSRDKERQILKSIPMTKDARKVALKQRKKFVETNGREPGKEDSMFFKVPSNNALSELRAEIMLDEGIDPAIIYAYKKTGMLVLDANDPLWSESDLAEWKMAIDEYGRLREKTELVEDKNHANSYCKISLRTATS